jgi:hypothetical protein
MSGQYKDGDPGFSILRPGETVPAARGGPADGGDFGWIRTGILDRMRNRRLARALEEHTAGLKLTTEYTHQAARYEEARQALALARERASLLPLATERDRERLKHELVAAQLELEALLQERQRAVEIADADHKIALIARKAEKLEAKARVKEAKRALKQAGKKPKGQSAADDMPEEFRRHWQTEQDVHRNRSESDARIAAIYDRARAERRNLSAEEIEEVDALANAADGAESEVRRRAASDF